MEGKKTPNSKRKSEEKNSAMKQAEDSFYDYKYKYTSFDEMKEQGEYNFYGIIYDASFPKEEENYAILPGTKEPLPKYSCVLKLLDQSTNCLTNPANFNENLQHPLSRNNYLLLCNAGNDPDRSAAGR